MALPVKPLHPYDFLGLSSPTAYAWDLGTPLGMTAGRFSKGAASPLALYSEKITTTKSLSWSHPLDNKWLRAYYPLGI